VDLFEELLEQSERLLAQGQATSHQADLRRAVSSAYYALFHFAIQECCDSLLGPAQKGQPLWIILSRAFVHEDMRETSKTFASTKLPEYMGQHFREIPAELKRFAGTFSNLQEQRHTADHDLSISFNSGFVEPLVKGAREVIEHWSGVRSHPTTKLYLLLLLNGKQIKSKKFATQPSGSSQTS